MTTVTFDAAFSVGAATNDTTISDDLSTSDMVVRATIDFWNTDIVSFAHLFGRSALGSANYYLGISGQFADDYTIGLYKNISETITDELTGQATPVPGDVFACSIIGDTILGIRNGVTILTANDSEVTEGTFCGAELQNDVGLLNVSVQISPSVFTPPGQNTIPPVLPWGTPEQTALGYKLFRHYRPRPEGINVFIYSDNYPGTTSPVSENEPDGEATVWFPSDRRSDQIEANTPYIVETFYGGHDGYNISQETADLLTAEGYTVT